MKTITTFLSVLVLISTAQFSQARLGESETQCDVRYNPEGKAKVQPSSEDKSHPLCIGQPLETITYNYQGWKLRIGFQGNLAICMEYSNPKKLWSSPSGEEINAILKANSSRGTWQSISVSQTKTNAVLDEIRGVAGGRDYWLRSDGSVAYLTGFFNEAIRLVLKKGVDIGLKAGLKQVREQEAAKKEAVPNF